MLKWLRRLSSEDVGTWSKGRDVPQDQGEGRGEIVLNTIRGVLASFCTIVQRYGSILDICLSL